MQGKRLGHHSFAQMFKSSDWLRGVAWMMASQGIKLVLQATYFVVVARALGVQQYGMFVGAASLVDILSPFAMLGSGDLMIKNVARDRDLFRVYWGNGLLRLFGSYSVLLIGLRLISPVFLPPDISPLLLILAAMTNLLFGRMLDLSAQAYQAMGRLDRTAQLSLLPHGIRSAAALAMVYFLPHPTALDWVTFSLVSLAASAGVSSWLVSRELGAPRVDLDRLKPELREGSYFAVGLSAQTVYNDIDKSMLSKLASLEAAGMYAAAYRIIDVAFVPLRSILAASYSKFFKQGKTGILGSLAVARKLVPIMIGYGVLAGGGILLCAPIVPVILGPDYGSAVTVLRWLAPLVLFKGLHYIAADTLSGADLQWQRSTTQVSIAVINVSLNLWLIPLLKWEGAVIASLVSDGLLMVTLWTLVGWRYRLERQALV